MAWPKNKEQWQKTQNQPNRTEITIVTTSQGCWKTAATKHLKSLTYSEISTLLSSNNYCPSLPAAVTTQVTTQIPRKGAGLSDTRAYASPCPTSRRYTSYASPREGWVRGGLYSCAVFTSVPTIQKHLAPFCPSFSDHDQPWSLHFHEPLVSDLSISSTPCRRSSALPPTATRSPWPGRSPRAPGPVFPASSLSAQRICVQQDLLRLWTRHGACPSPRRQGRGKDGAVTPDRKQQDPDLAGWWSSCWGPGLSPTGSCVLELKLRFWETLRTGSAGREGSWTKP